MRKRVRIIREHCTKLDQAWRKSQESNSIWIKWGQFSFPFRKCTEFFTVRPQHLFYCAVHVHTGTAMRTSRFGVLALALTLPMANWGDAVQSMYTFWNACALCDGSLPFSSSRLASFRLAAPVLLRSMREKNCMKKKMKRKATHTFREPLSTLKFPSKSYFGPSRNEAEKYERKILFKGMKGGSVYAWLQKYWIPPSKSSAICFHIFVSL